MNNYSATMTRNARKHANRRNKRNMKLRETLPRLEQWVFVDGEGVINLQGNVYNRCGFTDGTPVSTSPLIRLDHLTAITKSSTKYFLGTPHPDYIAYRQQNNLGPITSQVFYFN